MVTFQNPVGINGVTVKNILKTAYREIYPLKQFNLNNFYQNLTDESHKLKIDQLLLKRSLNVNFSGGEKKLMELLQVIILKPSFVLLDEIDTGLDIDALKLVGVMIKKLQKMGIGILLVTHQLKLLNLLSIQKLYVMKQGKIIAFGNTELLNKISKSGFENLKV
jgi:Fe-S cluster assembly ATP-binding protein